MRKVTTDFSEAVEEQEEDDAATMASNQPSKTSLRLYLKSLQKENYFSATAIRNKFLRDGKSYTMASIYSALSKAIDQGEVEGENDKYRLTLQRRPAASNVQAASNDSIPTCSLLLPRELSSEDEQSEQRSADNAGETTNATISAIRARLRQCNQSFSHREIAEAAHAWTAKGKLQISNNKFRLPLVDEENETTSNEETSDEEDTTDDEHPSALSQQAEQEGDDNREQFISASSIKNRFLADGKRYTMAAIYSAVNKGIGRGDIEEKK
ncbi:hypothetical protein C0Q70_15237 [Pomacea canaliculata]|uniref:Uncharacterized protein n=1 Tax=Pomacea canaliculata TaxID=400727 RepID=A0A2T7NUB6_POMCA|nr:hypothetical protein C0Q70_15237 [Pomacea canaliculata]